MLPGDGGPKYFGGSGAVLEFCVFNHPRTYKISAWFEVEIGGWVGWGGVGKKLRQAGACRQGSLELQSMKSMVWVGVG